MGSRMHPAAWISSWRTVAICCCIWILRWNAMWPLLWVSIITHSKQVHRTAVQFWRIAHNLHFLLGSWCTSLELLLDLIFLPTSVLSNNYDQLNFWQSLQDVFTQSCAYGLEPSGLAHLQEGVRMTPPMSQPIASCSVHIVVVFVKYSAIFQTISTCAGQPCQRVKSFVAFLSVVHGCWKMVWDKSDSEMTGQDWSGQYFPSSGPSRWICGGWRDYWQWAAVGARTLERFIHWRHQFDESANITCVVDQQVLIAIASIRQNSQTAGEVQTSWRSSPYQSHPAKGSSKLMRTTIVDAFPLSCFSDR